jgi:hypothetical protein|tara:strand:+ start:75 stop:203 length:129 start_codon:yes stop_codon:yes gene_type:complete
MNCLLGNYIFINAFIAEVKILLQKKTSEYKFTGFMHLKIAVK